MSAGARVQLLMSDVNEPVNIGNPQEMTTVQSAEMIRELVGSTPAITYHPLPQEDPKIRQPDITRARRLLGWEPKAPVRDALQWTLEDFRRQLKL